MLPLLSSWDSVAARRSLLLRIRPSVKMMTSWISLISSFKQALMWMRRTQWVTSNLTYFDQNGMMLAVSEIRRSYVLLFSPTAQCLYKHHYSAPPTKCFPFITCFPFFFRALVFAVFVTVIFALIGWHNSTHVGCRLWRCCRRGDSLGSRLRRKRQERRKLDYWQ
jgi:hypothetical protein